MKVLLQSYSDGRLEVADVPPPTNRRGRLVVRTMASLVSAGTERYQLDLARKSLVEKAMARPDLVARVVQKAQTDGVIEAWQQATQRLNVPVPLGYSSAGVVEAVGDDVEHAAVGDRVACAGSGYASHAEVVSVPARMCVRVPDGVDFESAAFVALGGVALEAMRMAQVTLGSYVGVIGLGLIGQIAVQLLHAAGCHVLGIDLTEARVAMARAHGADVAVRSVDDVAGRCRAFTRGQGLDACIILAAASSNEPLNLAAELVRERGRVVASGLVGLELPRKPFYDKELELVVSRAWGAGVYDPDYTERGRDYPLGYARWTAERNMQAFLGQVERGGVRLDHLITHRFPLERAPEAYELILQGREPSLGVLLTYARSDAAREASAVAAPPPAAVEHTALPTVPPVAVAPQLSRRVSAAPAAVLGDSEQTVGLALIGAGLFARTTLLPALRGVGGVALRGIVTASGVSAYHSSRQFGFGYATSDRSQVLRDPHVDGVMIATRHNLHAGFAAEALAAGKAVLVEKPLAVTREELAPLADAWREARRTSGSPGAGEPRLVVGYNRRYSPFVRQLREWLGAEGEPLAVHCRVNAGTVPADSWVHDPGEGGGRVIGEVCHFVDLIHALAGGLTTRVYAETLGSAGYRTDDNVAVTLHLANGAIGSIIYVANGDKSFPRERVEVFGRNAAGVIDNFRTATFTRGGKRSAVRRLNIDRGYKGELEAFVAVVRGAPPPVLFVENVATTLTTIAIEESLRRRQPVSVDVSEVLES
jgi:predicted dehydrogenase/threonine dehydrogenase-like Zn-dependent dehydrogenase